MATFYKWMFVFIHFNDVLSCAQHETISVGKHVDWQEGLAYKAWGY